MAELDDLLDEVLRGIGRNVLNLQKMEGMLKFIVSSTGTFDWTSDVTQQTKVLEQSIMSRRKATNRLSLGRLVDNLSQTLQSDQTDQTNAADSESDFCIEVSFGFEDEEFTNQLSQALRGVVIERNDLIHKRLVRFNPKSIKSCRELLRELNEQRNRIKPQFETLSAICMNLRDIFKQLKDYADSGSFADDISNAQEEWAGSANDNQGP